MRVIALLEVNSLAVALVMALGCQPGKPPAVVAPATEEARTLYALGHSLGPNVASFGLSAAEVVWVQQGLADAALRQNPPFAVDQYGAKLAALAQTRGGVLRASAKTAAADLLRKAAAEPGARTQPSGLVYGETKAGEGPAPGLGDTVRVHYRGTLADGTEFDSSHARGVPAEFALGSVIPCWSEGLALMRAGGKARLTCPPALGYGDRGDPPKIPGGAALSFDVELLSVAGAGAKKAP